jgi:glyoxylase-like metal-dependent hydrolase (beta-lactamase superfamily II)
MKTKFFKSSLLNIVGCSVLWMVITAPCLKAQDDAIIFDIGAATISLLSEGEGQGGTNILIGATDEMVKKVIPDGTYKIATNAFMVELEGKTLLFDAGLGQKTIDNLTVYGKKASEVDAVFITHFHGDHIGSLLINNQKGYPNATLYVSKPEYDYYMNDAEMKALPENRRGAFTTARNIFNAYKGKLEVFMPNEIERATELIPGVKSVAAYGHTPGHVGYLVDANGPKIFFWGDLAHAMAIQMPYPEVAVSYDSDPVKAVESRRKLLKYLSENKIDIAGAHIPYPGMGNLGKQAANGYDFTFMCSCGGRMPYIAN